MRFSRAFMTWPTSVVLAPLMASLALAAAGTQYKIVVPNALTDAEGNSASGKEPDTTIGLPFRTQAVNPADQFAALPATDLAITGIYARPDRLATPRSGTLGGLIIRLSTTERGPGELSTAFQQNLGDDALTVFQGNLPLATEAIGPDAGPKAFDYHFPFTRPFLYDPSVGRNLLVDFQATAGFSFVVMFDSSITNPNRTVFALGNAYSPEGIFYENSSVLQFVFEEVSPADFNLDLTVDHLDLALWQAGYGYPGGRAEGDADKDGLVTGADFLVWQREYVAGVPGLATELGIPEPSTAALALFGLCAWGARKRRF